MPSSATITSSDFTTFIDATTILAADFNNNNAIFRGHMLPVDPNTSAAADNSYDLGSKEYAWKRLYRGNQAGVTAFSGGGQGSAVTLTADTCFVATAAAAGDSVLLPTATGREYITVYNQAAANYVDIFPATSNTVQMFGTNTAYPLGAGESAIFASDSAASWTVVKHGGVYAKHAGAAGISLTAGTSTTLAFTTGKHDNLGAFVTSTGIYTAKVPGRYIANVGVQTDAEVFSAGHDWFTQLYKEGSLHQVVDVQALSSAQTRRIYSKGTGIVDLAVGETASLRFLNSALNTSSSANENENFIEFIRIGD